MKTEQLSEKSKSYIEMLRDIYAVSLACETKTYIWGGFTVDIFKGTIQREHNDLDGFTEGLIPALSRLTEEYQSRGYQTKYMHGIQMLEIIKGDIHAAFNGLELDGETAMWRHIGKDGTVYFPKSWLDTEPRDFYGVKVYSAGYRFDYAIKTKASMLTPVWELREKDHLAIAYWEEILRENGENPEDIYKWIWSYNPFWYKKGYDEFFRPTVAYPLQPK